MAEASKTTTREAELARRRLHEIDGKIKVCDRGLTSERDPGLWMQYLQASADLYRAMQMPVAAEAVRQGCSRCWLADRRAGVRMTTPRHYPLVSHRVPGERRVAGCACGFRGHKVRVALHLQATTADGWVL